MNTIALVARPTHSHTTRCWWSHLQAAWVCAAVTPPGSAADRGDPPVDRPATRELQLVGVS